MLVLTRKKGEVIIVGENDVQIIILGVRGEQVKLGFNADPSISVNREEVYQRIKREKPNIIVRKDIEE